MTLRIAIAALLTVPLTSQAALAFDCAKAATATETLICSNPAIKAADDAMAKAYAALRDQLDDTGRDAILAAQRTFLTKRDQCAESFDSPLTCLLERTRDQAALLGGSLPRGAMVGEPARIEPVFVQQDGSEAMVDVDYSLVRFADPRTDGERAFNRVIQSYIQCFI